MSDRFEMPLGVGDEQPRHFGSGDRRAWNVSRTIGLGEIAVCVSVLLALLTGSYGVWSTISSAQQTLEHSLATQNTEIELVRQQVAQHDHEINEIRSNQNAFSAEVRSTLGHISDQISDVYKALPRERK